MFLWWRRGNSHPRPESFSIYFIQSYLYQPYYRLIIKILFSLRYHRLLNKRQLFHLTASRLLIQFPLSELSPSLDFLVTLLIYSARPYNPYGGPAEILFFLPHLLFIFKHNELTTMWTT